MKENNIFNLEKYRLLSDVILYSGIEPDDFIGYERVEGFFGSLIPDVEFNDKGNIEAINEFVEMYPGIYPTNNRVTSSAVMFSGEFGCGKHTADRVLMNVTTNRISDMVDFDVEVDDVIKCYLVNISNFIGSSKAETCENIENIMNTIINAAASDTDVMFYFSLGDVTEIMKHKKTANCFSKMVKKFLLNHKTTSILTCCYEGSASGIKDRLKQPFYVYEFEAPDYLLRNIYFEKIRNHYYNIIFESSNDELAVMTEGFTFTMLKKLTAFILTSVKYKCVNDDIDFSMYLGTYNELSEDEKITVETLHIERFINNIKNTKYIRSKKQQIPVYAAPQNIVVTQQPQVIEQSYESVENLSEKEKAEHKANSVIGHCDTVAEWRNIVDSLHQATTYVPENFEKRKAEREQRIAEKIKMQEEQELEEDNA